MTEDVVKILGYLALGTRLRRIGECLQTQTQAVLEANGIDLPASHFPLLVALDRLGPTSVGDLTQSLGTSQPGVTRMLDKLEATGLVRSRQSADDRRVRFVGLTPSGRRMIAHSKKNAWPPIEFAVTDACSRLAEPLLAQLTALEDALAAESLSVRAERFHSGARKNARA